MNKIIKNSKTLSTLVNWKQHKSSLAWIIKHTKPFIPSLIILMLLSILSSATSIGMTLINRHILDTATAGGNFANSVILYVLILISTLVISAVSGFVTVLLNERFAFGIRLKIYNSVMHTCWSDISRYHSGDIITRLSSDVDIVAIGIAEVLPSIFSLGISLIAAFVTLAYFDAGIAIFALILGPITALVGLISARMLAPTQIKIQQSESAYKSFMQESIANLTVFKSFGAQESASDRISALRGERIYWTLKKQKISTISSALLSASFQVGYLGAFVYSALQLSQQLITYGTMSIFLTLVTQIQAPVVGLSRVIPRAVSIFTSASRIIELDGMQSEDMTKPSFPEGALGISANNISFNYGAEEIIKDASVTIEPGQFVAMMGSSGIGKTTFIRLAMSYLKPNSGEINLFAPSGEQSKLNAGARSYISYVPQGNTLISGKIIDNIRLGAPDISEEEIWELMRVVAVDDFVKNTPNGLQTIIGEKGLGLSEGQAQRLAICRALAKKAPILILDEATSALDEATEIAVLNHLREHVQGITCLLITHRKSVLKFCDRCICIDEKKIKDVEI